MIKGIGTDIIEINRFKALMDRHPKRFLERLFTQKECDYCNKFQDNEKHFTGRFSAKEAVAKALGCGFGANYLTKIFLSSTMKLVSLLFLFLKEQ